MGSNHLSDVDLAARVARLTAGQRECLDLVDDHATSKEIARQLDISRHTVDARLRGAIQTLGVSSRREAAIIYRAAMRAQTYQPLAYQSPRIVSAAARIETSSQELPSGEIDDASGEDIPATDRKDSERTALHAVRSDAAGFEPVYVSDSAVWSASAFPEIRTSSGAGSMSAFRNARPLLRLWGGANDLTPPQRMLGIFIVMIAGLLAFGLLLSGISALTLLRS